MKAFYDKEEKARRAWEEDQMKFIQEVRDRAERTKKATGEEADKLKAKGMKMWQEENQMAAARTANRRLELKKKMTEAPKVKVHSAGKNVLTEVNGAQTWVRVPEEFNYKSFKFVLKMDDFTELPDFVAAEYMRTQREKKRLSALDDVLAKQSKWEDVLKVAPEVDPTSAQIGTHVGYMEEHDNVKIE